MLRQKIKKNREKAMNKFVFAGVFHEEIPFQFLQMLTMEVMQLVRDIYNRVQHKYETQHPRFEDLYHKCVGTIANWDPPKRMEEIDVLVNKYPYINYYYKYTYCQFIKEILKTRLLATSDQYTIPAFDDFVFHFYCKCSQDPTFRNPLLCTCYDIDRLLFLCSIVLRATFTEFVEYVTIPQLKPKLTEQTLAQWNIQQQSQEPPQQPGSPQQSPVPGEPLPAPENPVQVPPVAGSPVQVPPQVPGSPVQVPQVPGSPIQVPTASPQVPDNPGSPVQGVTEVPGMHPIEAVQASMDDATNRVFV